MSEPNPHLQQLLVGLDQERAALQQEDATLRAAPLAQRVAAGAAWAPLDLVTTEHRSKDRVNVLLRGRDLHDGLAAGDAILLAPAARPQEGWTGRVEGADAGTVELRVDGVPDGAGPWAVSRRLDLTVLEGWVAALRKAESTWSPLKNLLLGYERPYRPDPLDHPALGALHPSQRTAAALALGATEIGLLHGPPGTGKTEVLAAILAALADLGERPWALAVSNLGADELALRAASRGLSVVRLGASARVGSRARHLTLEHLILHGPRQSVIHGLVRRSTRATGAELEEAQAAIREEWEAAKREILASANALVMTVGTFATRTDDLVAPRTAVVDEAAQLVEPAVWSIATRVKRLLLAGDPHQLGPTLRSRHAGLARPLLTRLVEAGFPFPMLTEQFRMNAGILAAVNPTYGGRLTAPPGVLARVPAELAALPSPWLERSLRFVDTTSAGCDEVHEPGGTLHNPGELGILRGIVAELRQAGILPEHVGIVAPYASQVARLAAAFPDLEVGRVEHFQGREKEILLASFVRSNPDGELGPVADAQRLNVALSRARRMFLGVGDAGTLARSADFARYIDEAGRQDGYTSAWELDPSWLGSA